ncbi:MAG: hypothetical protein M0Q14_10710 [Tissierellaceae bacterium]|nr:hypothetical protein [Tissierellaceae bacterium]
MVNEAQYSDMLRRIQDMETRINNLEKEMNNQAIADAKIITSFESIKEEFDRLREDVLCTIKGHTDNIWKLIHRGIYAIGFLILVILALVGIKIGPELINILK